MGLSRRWVRACKYTRTHGHKHLPSRLKTPLPSRLKPHDASSVSGLPGPKAGAANSPATAPAEPFLPMRVTFIWAQPKGNPHLIASPHLTRSCQPQTFQIRKSWEKQERGGNSPDRTLEVSNLELQDPLWPYYSDFHRLLVILREKKLSPSQGNIGLEMVAHLL